MNEQTNVPQTICSLQMKLKLWFLSFYSFEFAAFAIQHIWYGFPDSIRIWDCLSIGLL